MENIFHPDLWEISFDIQLRREAKNLKPPWADQNYYRPLFERRKLLMKLKILSNSLGRNKSQHLQNILQGIFRLMASLVTVKLII